MSRKPRIYYTETDKALMWDRWRKGDSLETIARLFRYSLTALLCASKPNPLWPCLTVLTR